MSELEGKVVVITGAGRGLGAAFALAFADSGCDLVLCGRNEANLGEVSDAIAKRGAARPMLVSLDLSDTVSVRDACAQIAGHKDRVDVLINNGALWLENSELPYSDEAVSGVINAAITGTFLFTQKLLPLLQLSNQPDVVTIGSVNGLPNARLQTLSVPMYAAKRGQMALADGLRQSLAGTPIRSITINPPYLDDARQDQDQWNLASTRQKGERATSRDVVEATLFAITRARNVTLNITIDADEDGLFSG